MKQVNLLKKSIAHMLSVLMIMSALGAAFSSFGFVWTDVANAESGDEIKVGDHVTMGNADAEGYTGTPYWRILDKDEDGNFLFMSEYLWTGDGTDSSAKIKFDPDWTTNVYQGSNAHNWCKSFEAAVLNNVDFLTIKQTTKDDKEYAAKISAYSTYTFASSTGILNNDKVFLLSVEEAEKYMSTETGRIAYLNDKTTAELWYLRSPDKDNAKRVGEILKNGKINRVASSTACGMRPVFWGKIDTDDVCISKTENTDFANTYDWSIGEHTPGVAMHENEISATCTKEGSYDEVVKCTTCEQEISRETKKIDKLAHTSGEPVRENEVAATEQAEGSYDEVVYCTECKTPISRESKVIPKLDPSTNPEDPKPSDQGQSSAATQPAPASVNSNTASAAAIQQAIKQASVNGAAVDTLVLGKKVKKISKNAFKGTDVKTIVVTSKKLKKKSVKGSLKGSKVTTVKVNVGKAKTNKKFAKKYKKFFTKKNAGKKAAVKKF